MLYEHWCHHKYFFRIHHPTHHQSCSRSIPSFLLKMASKAWEQWNTGCVRSSSINWCMLAGMMGCTKAEYGWTHTIHGTKMRWLFARVRVFSCLPKSSVGSRSCLDNGDFEVEYYVQTCFLSMCSSSHLVSCFVLTEPSVQSSPHLIPFRK